VSNPSTNLQGSVEADAVMVPGMVSGRRSATSRVVGGHDSDISPVAAGTAGRDQTLALGWGAGTSYFAADDALTALAMCTSPTFRAGLRRATSSLAAVRSAVRCCPFKADSWRCGSRQIARSVE